MMGLFLASVDENIHRKVWERENLPATMMKLLDLIIRLGDARGVSCPDIRWEVDHKIKHVPGEEPQNKAPYRFN